MSENLSAQRVEKKNLNFRICLCRQNFLSLDHPKTYKYMRRQWILIGQSILKTIRTIGDKKCPSRGGRNRTRTCAKSRPVTAGTVINGLSFVMYVEKLSCKRESEKPRERVVSLQLFLPPGHPIIYCEIKLFKMAAVSVKRVYYKMLIFS